MMKVNTNYNRRSFMRAGACAICACALGSVVSSCNTVLEGEPVIDLAIEERLQRIGGAIRKRFAAINSGESIFVIRESETVFIAYAAQCTHQHVELNLPKEGVIKCPNHGSLFRVSDGSVIDGKAYDPLKRYPVEYDEATQRLRILSPQTDIT